MAAMESLLLGKPQRIQSGSLLLGISSWHLYPDMSVHGKLIPQNDPLVHPAGLITVGLQARSNNTHDGFYWSLPLSHLRFYGQPVTATRRVGMAESRATFDQLLLVALGSLLSTWKLHDTNFEIPALLIRSLASKSDSNEWLKPFGRVCQQFLDSKGDEREECIKLISFGLRRCGTFLARQGGHPAPVFGFTSIPFLIRTLANVMYQVEFLRQWATTSKYDLKGAIIRYFLPTNITGSANRNKKGKNSILNVKPEKLDDEDPLWMDVSEIIEEKRMDKDTHLEFEVRKSKEDPQKVFDDPVLSSAYSLEQERFTSLEIDMPSRGSKRKRGKASSSAKYVDQHWTRDPEDNDEDDLLENDDHQLFPPAPGETPVKFVFVVGVPGLAALYCPSKIWANKRRPKNQVRYQLFLKLLQSEIFAEHHWHRTFLLLEAQLKKANPQYLQSLRALCGADSIYGALSDASVNLRLSARPLHESAFSKSLSGKLLQDNENAEIPFGAELRNLEKAFCCISLFETGHINLEPSDFLGVIAICHEDSIFVAQRLLQDPSDIRPSAPVRRIIGNIGRPGLAILVPPLAPEVAKVEHGESWRVVSYRDFDGKYENNFTSTSLHLSFTGSVLPLNTGNRGDIHRDAFFVETLIQVFDRGDWIADLDVLKAFSTFEFGWVPSTISAQKKLMQPLVSLDAWSELLDTPPPGSVVRANGNHLARLAAATVVVQRGFMPRVIHQDDHPLYDPKADWKDPFEEEEESDSTSVEEENFEPAFLQNMAQCDPMAIDATSQYSTQTDVSSDSSDESNHGLNSDEKSTDEADTLGYRIRARCSRMQSIIYIC